MKKLATVTAVIAAAVLASGCSSGGDNSGKASETSTPTESARAERVILSVEIHDQVPLSVYSNLDYHQCTSVSFADLLEGTKTPPVRIVVRDDDGKIVGTAKAPKHGGTFSKASGCTVAWRVTVPASDFYEVEVTGGSDPVTRKATVQSGGDEGVTSVSVDF